MSKAKENPIGKQAHTEHITLHLSGSAGCARCCCCRWYATLAFPRSFSFSRLQHDAYLWSVCCVYTLYCRYTAENSISHIWDYDATLCMCVRRVATVKASLTDTHTTKGNTAVEAHKKARARVSFCLPRGALATSVCDNGVCVPSIDPSFADNGAVVGWEGIATENKRMIMVVEPTRPLFFFGLPRGKGPSFGWWGFPARATTARQCMCELHNVHTYGATNTHSRRTWGSMVKENVFPVRSVYVCVSVFVWDWVFV